MLDPKLQERLAQGYAKLGDLGYRIALGLHKGKDNSTRQKQMWDQAIKLRYILNILFRHVTFETDNTPILWNISEEQVNKFVRYLLILGDFETYPIVPTILPTTKPIIFNKGAKGDQGIPGVDGSNANIVVRAKTGETEIFFTQVTDLDGTKAFEAEIISYSPQSLTGVFQGTTVFEVGVVVTSIDFVITSIKGANTITALTITDDSGANDDLQALLDLPTLNGLIQPVQYTVTLENISSNKSMNTSSTDGTTVVNSADTIDFYYPYLHGSSDTILGSGHYSAFTKTLAGKSNRSFNYNALEKYHYIMYPASYGVLTQLKDDNGFNLIEDYTTGLIDVTSVGLTNNWTVSYRFYRTTVKTDIENKLYSLVF